jgi:DNA-binding GntR family transcriptional regulator
MPAQREAGFQIGPVEGGDLLLDRVTRALRGAILAGELTPGTRLSVPELARQLNVSRTPAREALMRLEHEGLVSVTPRRGAVVLNAQTQDLEEIFQFREALEGMAARLATRKITDHELDQLREEFRAHTDAVHAHDLGEHVAHDRRFHEIIAQVSGNRRIAAELERVRSQLDLVTMNASTERGAVDERIVEAHREILDAIEHRDGRAAEAAARRHIRAISHFYREIGLMGHQD